MWFSRKAATLPTAEEALPGRTEAMAVPDRHFVLGTPLKPVEGAVELAQFGMGCFWGAEKQFWKIPGVHTTALVAFDPSKVSYETLLAAFWEHHDPTQGMRQGNDVGTQYRSAIYTYSEAQQRAAEASRDAYQEALARAGYGSITTEIREAPPFYYAEAYHQQYLAKNPDGYCGLGGTGVSCPVGTGA
jgi:peptide-methionine (S)-S-oxide reductase